MAKLEEYANKYENIRMERRDGILQVTLHTNGGTLKWGIEPHRDLGHAFEDIGRRDGGQSARRPVSPFHP